MDERRCSPLTLTLTSFNIGPCLQDYQISFTGRFNIYDLLLDQPYFDSSYGAVSKEHMTLIKVSLSTES